MTTKMKVEITAKLQKMKLYIEGSRSGIGFCMAFILSKEKLCVTTSYEGKLRKQIMKLLWDKVMENQKLVETMKANHKDITRIHKNEYWFPKEMYKERVSIINQVLADLRKTKIDDRRVNKELPTDGHAGSPKKSR